MMLLLGSHALRLRAPHLITRSLVDVDLMGIVPEVFAFIAPRNFKYRYPRPTPGADPQEVGFKFIARNEGGLGDDGSPNPLAIHEFECAWPEKMGSSRAMLLSLVADDPETLVVPHPQVPEVEVMLPSLGVLLALKESHRFLKNSPHFLKTMGDRAALLGAGVTIPERYLEWLKLRKKETYWYKHPKLNQDKKGFFSGDGVAYVFDHDSIHEAVKLHERPAYTWYQKDGEQVAVDRAKFEALPHERKVSSVLEESMVLALERNQIPHTTAVRRGEVPTIGYLTPRASFLMALEKVCTSITSGWWRDFAYDHYHEAVARFDETFVDRFWALADAGQVKLHVP